MNNKRLVAAGVLVTLWVAAFTVLDLGSKDSREYQQGAPVSGGVDAVREKAAWVREATYLYADNELRVGTDAVISPTGPLPAMSDAVRILVVGDSVTYGHGARDLDRTWWRILERDLDRRYGDGVFEIVTMARNGAALYRYADWLTNETISAIQPDMILLALNRNDVVPFGNEPMFCSDPSGATCAYFKYLQEYAPYQQCMAEADALPSADRPAAARTCARSARGSAPFELLDMNDLFQDPRKTVFAQEFDKAAAMIRRGVGDTPLLFMPALAIPSEIDAIDQLIDYFDDNGFRTVDAPSTRELLATGDLRAFSIHPADSHPGPLVNAALARDAAEAIIANTPATRIAAAERVAATRPAPLRPLVSNVLPASLAVTGGERVTTVAASPGRRPLARDVQLVPCADVMQPHTRIMLDPRLAAGTPVTVRVDESEEPLVVRTVGYVNDRQVIGSPTTVRSGASITITIGEQGATGALVTPASSPRTCDGGIDIPSGFTLTITR